MIHPNTLKGYPFTGTKFTGYPFIGIPFGSSVAESILLGFIISGKVTNDTSYTRLDPGYSIDQTGAPVEVAQDVPMYDLSSGSREFLSYSGTNKLKYSNDLSKSTWIKTNGTSFSEFVEGPFHNTIASNIAISGSSSDPLLLQTIAGAIAGLKTYNSLWFKGSASLVGSLATIFIYGSTALEEIEATTLIITGDWQYFDYQKTFSGSAVSVSYVFRFDPVNIAVSGEMAIYQCQSTETLYKLPDIPTTDLPVTVNQGTTSILAEDIDENRSYYFQNSEYATGSANTNITKSAAFDLNFKFYSGDVTNAQTIIENTINTSDIVAVSIASGTLRAGIYNGTSIFVKKSGSISINTVYTCQVIFNGSTLALNINTIAQTGTNDPAYSGTIGFTLGAKTDGSAKLQNCKIWDLTLVVGRTTINAYYAKENRYDKFIPDSIGTLNLEVTNYSSTFRHVDTFGHNVTETAPTIGTYTTADGVATFRTLKDLFGGDADGADLVTNGDFATESGWVKISAACVDLSSGYAKISGCGAFAGIKQQHSETTTTGSRFELKYLVMSNTLDVDILQIGGAGSRYLSTNTTIPSSVGEQVYRFTSDNNGGELVIQIPNSVTSGYISIDNIYLREVSPAYGSIRFNAYVPADLTEDMPICEFETDDLKVPYVEATTGLIKASDGTNTVVSASAVVADTYVSGWLSWYYNQSTGTSKMHITLDGTKGTVSDFVGYWPDIGTRIFAITSTTLQRVTDLYFDTEIPFVYVTDEITGEYVLDEITNELSKEYT